MLRKKIKAEALKQGLSVYKLAKESNLQITQLNNYLKGLNDLQGENIDKLLKVLNIGLYNAVNLQDIQRRLNINYPEAKKLKEQIKLLTLINYD